MNEPPLVIDHAELAILDRVFKETPGTIRPEYVTRAVQHIDNPQVAILGYTGTAPDSKLMLRLVQQNEQLTAQQVLVYLAADLQNQLTQSPRQAQETEKAIKDFVLRATAEASQKQRSIDSVNIAVMCLYISDYLKEQAHGDEIKRVFSLENLYPITDTQPTVISFTPEELSAMQEAPDTSRQVAQPPKANLKAGLNLSFTPREQQWLHKQTFYPGERIAGIRGGGDHGRMIGIVADNPDGSKRYERLIEMPDFTS